MSGPLRMSRSALACLAWVSTFACMFAPTAGAQGFGASKKKIILNRKLPPTAHLTGNTFKIEVSAHGIQQDVPEDLKSMLATELMKNDARLREDDHNPDTIITCTVTQYSQPTPQSSTTQQYQLGSKKPQNVTVTRYSGLLTVAYQARHAGRTLDSANITSKYDDEFDASGSTKKGIAGKITGTFGTIAHGKSESDMAPSQGDIRNKLLSDAAKQIASRLVVSDESVEVMLAGGKLSDYDRLAENGRWSDYLEKLETMTPLPGKEDDAYRLYNIGVAYEALGYAAEDQKTARKNLQDAAINYGKAADGKPSEKYFIAPQNRIETALLHYKQLEGQKSGSASASADSGTSTGSTSAGSGTSRSARGTTARSSGSASSKGQTASAKPPAAAASKSSQPPLTNEQVIKLVKANVDEENIIDTIRHAPAVNFDLSVDGEVNLANNGVKGKILTAMKARSRQGKTASQ